MVSILNVQTFLLILFPNNLKALCPLPPTCCSRELHCGATFLWVPGLLCPFWPLLPIIWGKMPGLMSHTSLLKNPRVISRTLFSPINSQQSIKR